MNPNTPSQNSRRNWRDDAECAKPGRNPETWYPIGTAPKAVAQGREAKGVCRGCPVLERCLQWALDTAQNAGILGGLDEGERRKMQRRAADRRTQPGIDPAVVELADERTDAIRRMVIGQQLPTRAIARRLGVDAVTAAEAVWLLGLSTLEHATPRVHLVRLRKGNAGRQAVAA